MFFLIDGFFKMMNFKYVFCWYVFFLLLFLFICCVMVVDMLLIFGDSLSVGYWMVVNVVWFVLFNEQWQVKMLVVNVSISGDILQQGLVCLLVLFKQYQLCWVLVEFGGNDGLCGFLLQQIEQMLCIIIKDIKVVNVELLLM